jgi:hypothetical protein
MLKIIPLKSTGNVYIGTSSGYKPAKVITAQSEKPSIAVTSNSDISSWDINADIVFETGGGGGYCADKVKEEVVENPRPIEATCMLDEAGCITTDSSKAKSILYQEVKDGRIITRQEPVSDMDREIANLWNLIKEIDKGFQERELMWQRINEELDRAHQLLKESNKTSYWAYTVDGDYHTWEV